MRLWGNQQLSFVFSQTQILSQDAETLHKELLNQCRSRILHNYFGSVLFARK